MWTSRARAGCIWQWSSMTTLALLSNWYGSLKSNIASSISYRHDHYARNACISHDLAAQETSKSMATPEQNDGDAESVLALVTATKELPVKSLLTRGKVFNLNGMNIYVKCIWLSFNRSSHRA